MKTPHNYPNSIRERLSRAADVSGRVLWGAKADVGLGDVLRGTRMGGRLPELAGESVLLATRDQLASAVALIELDGVARRVVICPPDVPADQIPAVIANAEVTAIVSDYEVACSDTLLRVKCGSGFTPAKDAPAGPGLTEDDATEWVLLTSGTTAAPKMIVHTLASLIAPIDLDRPQTSGVVWGTFYDIRRYGGLQIFLRAVLAGGSLVLASAGEPVADHLARLGACGVTHLSGTPSHWRRALMSPLARAIAPKYIRLSGEIADQAILNALHTFYPNAAVSHAFASTEAGLAFEVNDGLAGFPANFLGRRGDVEMRVADDSLRISSNRVALRYLGGEGGAIADGEGFVDTGDVVKLSGDRYHFLGRRNGAINVGGLKVYPEEVEAVINRHPAVRMSMVRARRNPFTGALVSADVVLKDFALQETAAPCTPEPDGAANPLAIFRNEVLEMCRRNLPAHKIPVIIRCVPALEVAAAGKLVRQHA